MRRDRIRRWIAAGLCVLVPLGGARKTPEQGRKASEDTKETVEQMDVGTFEGSMYRNKYLGFRLWVHPDWSIQDQQEQKRMTAKGVQVVAGDHE